MRLYMPASTDHARDVIEHGFIATELASIPIDGDRDPQALAENQRVCLFFTGYADAEEAILDLGATERFDFLLSIEVPEQLCREGRVASRVDTWIASEPRSGKTIWISDPLGDLDQILLPPDEVNAHFGTLKVYDAQRRPLGDEVRPDLVGL